MRTRRKWLGVGLVCWSLLTMGQSAVYSQSLQVSPAWAKTSDQLIQENQSLQQENAKLRARLAELEHSSVPTEVTTEAAPADQAMPAGEPIPAPATVIAPTEPAACCHDTEAAASMRYGERTRKPTDPSDLTLWNFFSAGWNEAWTKRSSEDRAPDLALIHVQTNFMERELRFDSFYENNVNNKKFNNIYSLDGLIAYGWNRRIQTNVQWFSQWNDGRDHDPDLHGQVAAFLTRFQLISTPDSSYALNLRYTGPNPELGNHESSFVYGLAGFEDLTGYGLYRVGLYTSAQFETLNGPAAAGAQHNDVQYVVTLAKTLTRPDTPLIGNFTVYVENFAQTSLDGTTPGRTVAGIMPGIRFNLGKLPNMNFGADNWILFGVDLPVAGPVPWDSTYRLTYIKNF